MVRVPPLISAEELKKLNESIDSLYIILIISDAKIELQDFAFERFKGIAGSLKTGLLYSDYYECNGSRIEHPLIEYQTGSVRDDFDFGHLLFFVKDIFSIAVNLLQEDCQFAALYELRLIISETNPVIRIPEYLYSISSVLQENDDKQFNYVDPKNRIVQIEMENVFTEYLKRTNVYLLPENNEIEFYSDVFESEVSVIIPVKNRVKTITDAINSVLNQKTAFPFNLIIIDNHSDDGTSNLLTELSKKHKILTHLIPERTDLLIGGCWNEGIFHKSCGRFAVQLDSDDIYSDESTLQKIVDKFKDDKCAMVIGSYRITDFMYNTIPPGIIDHKEWTFENGLNNVLRINGFGAPRAFFTPIIRNIGFPNVSYGEDYAASLAVSRNYKIGRIYEPIYICRRWEGNSDALLTIEKQNRFNFYKDKIRTLEILIRRQMNSEKCG